jgi:hypothetical protein
LNGSKLHRTWNRFQIRAAGATGNKRMKPLLLLCIPGANGHGANCAGHFGFDRLESLSKQKLLLSRMTAAPLSFDPEHS